jgi:hypothetical protein
MQMPHLLDIQTRAFESLLQLDAAAHDREDVGLERVFKDLFPITDVHENFSLDFKRYTLGEPKYSVEECIERDMTYSAPLKATLVLTGLRGEPRRQQEAPQEPDREGSLPRRAAAAHAAGHLRHQWRRARDRHQLHRSPGVVFEESTHPNGQRLISSRIIPFRGSWVEFTVDIHDVIFVHIDKKKKFPATALLRAFGYGSNADIYRLFFGERELDLTKKRKEGRDREVIGAIIAESIELPGEATAEDAPKAKTKKARAERERAEASLLVSEGDELTEEVYNRLRRQKIDRSRSSRATSRWTCATSSTPSSAGERPSPRTLAQDVVDPATGEVVAEAGQALNITLVKRLRKAEHQQGLVLRGLRPRREHARQEHPPQGPHQVRGRGAQADLLAAPSGRRAEQGDREAGARAAVLQPQALRPRPRGALQDQSAPAPQHAGEPHRPHHGRLHRHHPLPRGAPRGARARGRHRPPGQPPHPLGGRAHRQPVLRGPLAHGAPGQGAHEHQHRTARRSRSTTS